MTSRPNRLPGTRPLKKTVLVFTEGEETERQYIDALKRTDAIRRNTAIHISKQRGAPMTLIQKAIKITDYDEVWCLFDVEAPIPQVDLKKVRNTKGIKKINLAISNPCFELWLILHDRNQDAYITTDAAIELSEKLSLTKDKYLVDSSRLMSQLQDATNRAAGLRTRNMRIGKEYNPNPSTDVDKFIKSVIGNG